MHAKRLARRVVIGLLAVGAVIAGAVIVVEQSKVPRAAIESAVTRTPALLERAWQLPVASTFGHRVVWQSNGSRCGPAALANVNRSLGDDATSETRVLADTGRCWTGVCVMGLTLDELAAVARATSHRDVTVLRGLTPTEFLTHLRHSNDPSRRYIVNFDRATIFGAGAGHHSPIGGYLEAEDLVLVLDVNESFGPWLVQRSRLYAAIETMDGDRKRGLLLIM